MPDHDAFRPDGRLNIPSQAAADYIAREGTLQPYEPTMREKAESAIAGALESLGMSKSSARDSAVGFTGTTDSSRGGMGIGALDFFPLFSFPTAGQEVSREVKGLMNNPDTTATDYIAPALTAVLTGVEAIPATKLATKPLKGFIDNLATKAEPVETSRRSFLKGAAVAPLAAGALTQIPLKSIKSPELYSQAVSSPSKVDIFELDTFQDVINEVVDRWQKSNPEKDISDYVPELDDVADYMEDSGVVKFLTGEKSNLEKVPEEAADFVREMKNSGMNNKMILEELGLSGR